MVKTKGRRESDQIEDLRGIDFNVRRDIMRALGVAAGVGLGGRLAKRFKSHNAKGLAMGGGILPMAAAGDAAGHAWQRDYLRSVGQDQRHRRKKG